MDALIAKSGREYVPLPIDNKKGFPQTFPMVFNGQTYHFRLYVNIASNLLNDQVDFIELPKEKAFLVVHVERDAGDGIKDTILLRKVVPELEYEAQDIMLYFPLWGPDGKRLLRIARDNLNGQGNYGSQVIGGIAKRWA